MNPGDGDRQASIDAEHLRLLSIFHFVSAGFSFLGVIFVLWFLVAAAGNLLSGLYLRKARHRTFSMVVAGINCLHIPLGTVLGIMTFIVLTRDSVRARYESQDPRAIAYV